MNMTLKQKHIKLNDCITYFLNAIVDWVENYVKFHSVYLSCSIDLDNSCTNILMF